MLFEIFIEQNITIMLQFDYNYITNWKKDEKYQKNVEKKQKIKYNVYYRIIGGKGGFCRMIFLQNA